MRPCYRDGLEHTKNCSGVICRPLSLWEVFSDTGWERIVMFSGKSVVYGFQTNFLYALIVCLVAILDDKRCPEPGNFRRQSRLFYTL